MSRAAASGLLDGCSENWDLDVNERQGCNVESHLGKFCSKCSKSKSH